jgi:hypothetical protein
MHFNEAKQADPLRKACTSMRHEGRSVTQSRQFCGARKQFSEASRHIGEAQHAV